jgi:hypothetical protein
MSESKASPCACGKSSGACETPKASSGASKTIQNGKGDAPRNISMKFRCNYDAINWGGSSRSRSKSASARR